MKEKWNEEKCFEKQPNKSPGYEKLSKFNKKLSGKPNQQIKLSGIKTIRVWTQGWRIITFREH
jgi:hypothetical protein